MKKIILLMTITSILFSCSTGGDASSNNSNNNGNSFTNSMDYEFTITINGEIHKVKGNTTNGIPLGSNSSTSHTVNNACYILQGDLNLQINDVTSLNYISGQNMQIAIFTTNLLLGTHQALVIFSGGYFNAFSTSGFINFSTDPTFNPGLVNKLPITITDLGTPTDFSHIPYNFGRTLKGNYNGTIYLSGNIPVQLSIDFKALRLN